MTKYQHANELKSLLLGKETNYSSKYSPDLLQNVPRQLNRQDLLINQSLPFYGEDVWYGYEISWLNAKGKPIVAVAEFRFPCTSTHLIESKSFKLYLNSFNQTQFDSWQQVQQLMVQDLSNKTNAKVSVTLFEVEQCPALAVYSTSANCIDSLDISIDQYQLNPDVLSLRDENNSNESVVKETLVSHLLKSNCLITNQPDWASIFISYEGLPICHESLLRYIISFRQHNEFHEQCVERIFCDILHHCQPTELTIYARYTRRGGLDINPYRSTVKSVAPNGRTLRQ